jgi:predicted dehydrogenase
MASLRIGILGSGYMGATYAECIARHNQRATLVAIAGGSRAPALAATYGVAHLDDDTALFARDDIDAVLIATPHALHHDQTVRAAAAGKHVLLEKPMAPSVAECDSMIAACERAGVTFEVIKTLRFRGSISRALQLIADGAIGRVRMINGRTLAAGTGIEEKHWAARPESGGMLLDMGCHNFDIICAFAGSEPRRISACVETFAAPAHRRLSAMSQISFADGAMAQMWMSFEMPRPSLPDHVHCYLVVGETGTLDIDGYGALALGRDGEWREIWRQPPIDWINRPFEPVRLEAFFLQTQSFIDDILDGRPATVAATQGRRAVAMVEGAWRSALTGATVELDTI